MHRYGSLENYLESLRKRAGLTQEDIAFMLGESRQQVCDYECGRKTPHVRSAIALEMIFREPMQRLFAGVAERKRREVAALAWTLLESASDQVNERNAQRLETLYAIATATSKHGKSWRNAA